MRPAATGRVAWFPAGGGVGSGERVTVRARVVGYPAEVLARAFDGVTFAAEAPTGIEPVYTALQAAA